MILSPATAAKADEWSSFFGFWGKAAGENLASHSRPVDVRNGIVFIEADHPGWIQLLQMDQNRILETIRRTFPQLGISGIAFKIAKDPSLPGTVRSPGSAGNKAAEGQSSPEVLEAARASRAILAREDAKRSAPMPTVKQTISGVADDSFRGILSSLADTLETSDKGKALPKK
jgi:hypothetical protein